MPMSVDLPLPRAADAASAASGSDRALSTQEEEDLMSEIILKHRSELTKFVVGHGGATPTPTAHTTATAAAVATTTTTSTSATTTTTASGNAAATRGDQPQDAAAMPPPAGFRTPQPERSKAAQRLMELSRTERTDRMRLAELSDVRNERMGRAALLKWNPHAKLNPEREAQTYAGEAAPRTSSQVARARWNSSPVRTTAKMLGAYTKDYVQQALDFNGAEDDDEDDDAAASEDTTPPSPSSVQDFLSRQPRDKRSSKAVRKYVRHMEATIQQLVQQKDELMRNQVEFDKHASGIFPTLETLNDQLSQIVQDRMAESQANIKDDVGSQLRALETRLGELEAELRQRRNDAELMEQKRQIDLAQIKGDIASLSTTSTLQNQKMELLTSQEKKIEQDLRDSLKIIQGLSQEFHVVEKRISVLKTQRGELTVLEPEASRWPRVAMIVAVVIVLIAVAIALLTGDRCSGVSSRCHPLT